MTAKAQTEKPKVQKAGIETSEAQKEKEQKQKDKLLRQLLQQEVTRENCGTMLKLIKDNSNMTLAEMAEILGVSVSTLSRIIRGLTLPGQSIMNRLRIIQLLGQGRVSSMSEKEKKSLSEYFAALGGAAGGLVSAIGAISAGGTVAGLSGAGIATGLAALGSTMLGGIVVVGSIPVAAAAAGYGIVKAIKAICKANKLKMREKEGWFEFVTHSESGGKGGENKKQKDK